MNHSNRYGIESMARERQAEIEQQLRQSAELRNLKPERPNALLKVKWAAVGATAISVMGTIAFVVISHAR